MAGTEPEAPRQPPPTVRMKAVCRLGSAGEALSITASVAARCHAVPRVPRATPDATRATYVARAVGAAAR